MKNFYNNNKLVLAPSGEEDIYNLTSTIDEINSGYKDIVNTRMENMSSYIDESIYLREILIRYLNGEESLIEELKSYFLIICGITDSTIRHLSKQFVDEVIDNLMNSFNSRDNEEIIDEMVSRFLLVRGLSFGGNIKTITGKQIEEKLVRNIISVLGASCDIYISYGKIWSKYINSCPHGIKAISWEIDGKNRTILLNFKLPLVQRNIDFTLLESSYKNISFNYSSFNRKRVGLNDIYRDNVDDICVTSHLDEKNYLLIGKIKNVMTPHKANLFWRESYHALSKDKDTIEDKINKKIHSVFMSSVIYKGMISEIYEELKNNSLSYAVNLLKEPQVEKFCEWLITI